ncbi:hypothetical protein GCM10023310_69640 [Paenibacillus vulneris]|uniref:3D domain-containing protein n=1 Tax=Paenibacillus vulneris TaxID=1133364 RepID=A0ABW3UFD7_9BACL
MRKIILSSVAAITLLVTQVEIAYSTGEIKNTDNTKILPLEIVHKFKKETISVKDEKEDSESKHTIKFEDLGIQEITAFTSGYESTQKKKGHPLYGITASGTKAKQGRTVACPKTLPFGTEVYIPELDHTYVCEDRGAAITEGHLDIYFDNLKDAKEFGRQKLRVKIKVDFD